MIPEEILNDYREKYEEARRISGAQAKGEAINESCMAAIDMLLELKTSIGNTLISVYGDDLMYQILLAFIYRDIGRFYILCDNIEKGEAYMKECIELVKLRDMKSEAIVPYIGVMVDLAFSYTTRREYQKSLDILIEAEKSYKTFKQSSNQTTVRLEDVFCGITNCTEEGTGLPDLENLYTIVICRLSEIYHKIGEKKLFVQYTYALLIRKIASHEASEIALNSSNMSNYYIKLNRFKEGRLYMAAATLFLTQYQKQISEKNPTPDEEFTVKQTYAYVARRWAKYGLALLAASKERLSNDNDQTNLEDDIKRVKLDDDDMPYPFTDLQLNDYEKEISADYCHTFKDAKKVYHFVCKWLDIAKEFYKPERDTITYADVMKDYAKLYQNIAFFEKDHTNQFKMQKQRIRYYEELVPFLNRDIYLPICRECWCEAAFGYCDQIDIQRQILMADFSPSFKSYNRIQQIVKCAIGHFQNVIESYKEGGKSGSSWIPKMSFEEKKMLMVALLNVGKLHAQTITNDNTEHLSQCLYALTTFVDECDKDQRLSIVFNSETGLCRKQIYALEKRFGMNKT